MCESERERQREGERDRRWRRSWTCTIGLDMNAPQHSFPHIPFNFNSLIELATLCCTHPHRAEGKKLSLVHVQALSPHHHIQRKFLSQPKTLKPTATSMTGNSVPELSSCQQYRRNKLHCLVCGAAYTRGCIYHGG